MPLTAVLFVCLLEFLKWLSESNGWNVLKYIDIWIVITFNKDQREPEVVLIYVFLYNDWNISWIFEIVTLMLSSFYFIIISNNYFPLYYVYI